MVAKDGILLLGGDGMLGRILRENWSGRSLAYTTRREKSDPLALYCDLERSKFENNLPRTGIFIMAAGITTFQGCEQTPERAWVVNVEAVGKIAKHCSRHGIQLIFLSSSSIFDGIKPDQMETDLPNPMTLYGKMKKEAEDLVKSSGCLFKIVRLTKIMDSATGFMQDCCSRTDSGKSITASPLLPVAPLRGKWVQEGIQKCVNIIEEMILHFSPIDETSYHNLALEIVAKKKRNKENVLTQSETDLRKKCSWIPSHAKLGTRKSSRMLNLEMPRWIDILQEIK